VFSFFSSAILMSFTSLPRKTMYSYTVADGAISSAGLPRLPSVP